jgi:transposase
MVEALLAGHTDPVVLADLARGRRTATRAPLEEALVGVLTPPHRFLLAEHLSVIETRDDASARVSQDIAHRLDPPPDPGPSPAPQAVQEQTHAGEPSALHNADQDQGQDPPRLSWAHAIVLLWSIPGMRQRSAEGMLADIGVEMSRFPTSGPVASWAGMCPGHHERAGTRLSGTTRTGSPWLRTWLGEAAHAAAQTTQTSLSAFSQRLTARQGATHAAIALGHTRLVICSHVLDRPVSSEELGGNSLDERDRQATEKRLVRRVETLGSRVEVQPASQVA